VSNYVMFELGQPSHTFDLGKVASGTAAERYSTLRALSALSRADVAVLVIDAVEGLTAQDAHVAGYAIEEGKGLVIAVNKWDLVAEKTDRTFDQYTPTFVFFASDASVVHFSYRRYLENRLRETFGFDGTPIRLIFRTRSSVKLPRRRKSRSVPAQPAKRTRAARPK